MRRCAAQHRAAGSSPCSRHPVGELGSGAPSGRRRRVGLVGSSCLDALAASPTGCRRTAARSRGCPARPAAHGRAAHARRRRIIAAATAAPGHQSTPSRPVARRASVARCRCRCPRRGHATRPTSTATSRVDQSSVAVGRRRPWPSPLPATVVRRPRSALGQDLGVAGLGGQQLGVRALGDDTPALDHRDPVGQADGRQPVGDDQRGAVRS